VHVGFNVAGVMIWFMFIDYLAEFVTWMSPAHPELQGAERLGAETPRQIANAHTIFNIANTLIFIGFTTQIARLVERLIPDTPLETEGLMVRAKYLSDELLATPTLALDRVRLEVLHMGEKVQNMLDDIMPAILSGNREKLLQIRDMDEEVDLLYDQIIEYMGKISKRSLSDFEMDDFLQVMSAVGNLENIGDTIETNLVNLGLDRINAGISISKPTRTVLKDFHQAVTTAFHAAIQAVSQHNREAAQSVIAMQEQITGLATSAAAHQAVRLVADEPNRIPAYTIEIDIIEKQKRIYSFAKNMAESVMASDSEQVGAVIAEG
jgi:phosphate:Na+ symporter